ncbi:pentapeptide repeat-containing protein [Sodalis sp. RH15]|uniref:pentapeptide repeat-containing protein n=1 Tax=Sodalis sp. RH15 TaxID=3394330 RepID=UPI0039B68203
MPLININTARMNVMAQAVAGIGTETARSDANSLRGILEHIVNFFTAGYLCKQRAVQYDAFTQALATALDNALPSKDSYILPQTLIIDYAGYTVTFMLPGENHDEAGPVAIRVSQDGKSVDSQVDKIAFCRICTVLLIRQRHDLAFSAITLTDQGNIDLRGANLRRADLSELDLRGADLSGADLREADLSKSDLGEASLKNAILLKTDLTDVQLAGTYLCNADLNGAKLNGANLSNLSRQGPLLYFPPWDADNIKIFLDHRASGRNGSLLTMMDSIDERYADVKVQMARELMHSLQDVDVSSVALLLRDVLSKAPYSGDAGITAWLDGVCDRYLGQYDTKALPLLSDDGLEQVAGLFSHQPERMFTHNSAFIQWVAQGMKTGNDAIKASIIRLYDSYLNHERVRPYAAVDEFGDYGAQRPDWRDEHAANHILFPSRPDGPVMLLSAHTLQGMLHPDPLKPVWDGFYLYNRRGENLLPSDHPPETLFDQDFKLFLAPYRFAEQLASFAKLLGILGLGERQELFISATRSKTSKVKLVSPESQEELRKVFRPKLTYSTDSGDYSLTSGHYDEIIMAYGLSSAGNDVQAKTLLSLAAVFTKYSSSAIFGTEHESPEMLRRYACALMEKANALDEKVFMNGRGNAFTNWKNRLLGLEGAQSCSAMVSFLMVGHIRENFPDVLGGILPPAWC